MAYPNPSFLRFSIRAALLAAVSLGVFPVSASPQGPWPEGAEATAGAQSRLAAAYGRLPLLFERNQGQTDPAVDFLCRASGMTLWLAGGESVVALKGSEGEPASVVRMRLVGAAARPAAVGEREQASRSNYLLGADPAQWHTGVTHFAAVRYRDVYPGIDLVYHGDRQRLEYDFAVAPGARAEQIRLRFTEVERVEIGKGGELLLHTRAGVLTQEAPVAWQEGMEGRTPVTVRYAMASPQGEATAHEVWLVLGERDRTRRLVIDPVLVFGTYLGGVGDDYGNGIAVDGSGNAYITGHTRSADFPISGSPLQASHAGADEVFVTKFNATSSSLVYSTYLGGVSYDDATGIAVDASGNAYVTGSTFSIDFPTTSGAFQASKAGETDAFIAKLDASGSSLVYSTYLGGRSDEGGRAVAIDASGSATVTGLTFSSDFPTSSPFQASLAGDIDAFVTQLDAAGSSLVYSTYLGGARDDQGFGIAVDGSGNAYVTGSTYSMDFPTSSGALQASWAGEADAFVTKLDAAGSSLVYSTYLGGASGDAGAGIAVDASGNAYVTGFTTSTDFPTSSSPLQASHAGGFQDAFVTKLDAAGSSLVYSTYLGGASGDQGTGIALDASGNACVTGFTQSTNFPTSSNHFQASNGGLADAFVTQLDAAGSSLVYSTYLGGARDDQGLGIAVDASGNAWVTGVTFSTNFPTASEPFQASKAGLADAFVARLGAVQSILEVPTLSAGMLVLLALALAGLGAARLRRS